MLANNSTIGQQVSRIWYFGDNAGIDFNYQPPLKIEAGNHSINEGGVTITDENGDVLFYVDESTVYNRNNMPMKNGQGFIGNTGSSAQSPIAVQAPGNPNYVYIFYVSDHLDSGLIGQLRYSVIDLCGDSGKGEILPEKKNIRIPGKFNERLTACYDSKNKKYWIITGDFDSQTIVAFKLDVDGLDINPVYSSLNHQSQPSYIGMIVANATNNKLAYTCGLSGDFRGVFLVDFDVESGKASNSEIVFTQDIYDVVFSDSGRYLYMTDIFASCNLYKIDLEDRNKDKVLYNRDGNYVFMGIEKGPDGNIYLALPADNAIARISNHNSENETFEEHYFQFSGNQYVQAGLQSTNYFNGIIKEQIVANELGRDTFFCGEFQIDLNSGIAECKWSNGMTGSSITVSTGGTYYYYYRVCDILYTDTIHIFHDLDFDQTSNITRSFCFGDSIYLEGFDENTIWDNGYQGLNLLVKNEGTFTATISDECLRKHKVYHVVGEYPLPEPVIGDTTYCYGTKLDLEIPPLFVLSDSKGNIVNKEIMINLNGVYNISAQNACNMVSKTFVIKVDTFPLTLPDTIIICDPNQFPFVLKTGISNTQWNEMVIGDKLIVSQPGKYSYSIQNKCGEFRGRVDIVDNGQLYLPNIFSPNDDGFNDTFPGTTVNNNFIITIYDRWGNLIYTGSDDWNGLSKGKKAVPGVYCYIILSDSCSHHIMKGSVTLVR